METRRKCPRKNWLFFSHSEYIITKTGNALEVW